MSELSERDLLQYAIDKGIINLDNLSDKVQQMKNKELLSQHFYAIWQGKDGKWYTHIIQEDKRKLIKRKTQKDLEEYLLDYYRKANDIGRKTFEECFKEWVDQKLRYKEICQGTHNRYEQAFNKMFGAIKDKKVDTFEEVWLEDYCKCVIADQGLTSKRWGEMRTMLKGTFIYARKHNYTNFNVTDFLANLELSNRAFEKKFYETDELIFDLEEVAKVRSWIECQEPSVVNLGILLDLETGLRPGELAALKWVDVTNNRIEVRATEIRYKDDEGYHVEIKESPKTEAGFRKVVITPYAQTVIKKLRVLNPFGEYVFMEDGERKKRNAFSRKLRKICRYCGIKEKSLNKCRKTYATTLINGGVDRSVITSMMGHTDIDTTLKFYYKPDKTYAEEEEQIFAAFSRR